MSSFKFAIRPAWIVGLALLVALGWTIKVAMALLAYTPNDAPIGYVAQDEMTNFNLKSGREVLFRGQYEREFWSGTLFAYRVDSAGNVKTATSWWTADAGELIGGQNHDTERKIATMRDDGTAVAFRYASLSDAQKTDFPGDVNLVNYLRGDRSNELPVIGGTFRQRASVMGAVVHSRPLYVADDDNPTVFVGANDGMLHAINAAEGGGQERWAYIPSMLLPRMQRLAAEPYVHTYMVDGQINVGLINSGAQRVLVGALGAGGKGLYALNITDSAGLAAADEDAVASKVMWEITPTAVNYAAPTTAGAYSNLGYTYGTVSITKVRVGGAIVDAVIIGNGYNDGGDYGAYLYVINASTGQLIKRFKGGDGSLASPNGLSTPAAIDSDRDGVADTAYAGDLNGTMWKFNLTIDMTDPTTVATSGAGVTALLVTSPAQAITSTPGVAIHPNGGYMVTFGTGKALVDADLTDTTVHYVYGVWDRPTGVAPDNDTLLVQTLGERAYVAGGVTTRVRRIISNQTPNWANGVGNHKGWQVALRMRLADGTDGPGGERVLGEGSFIENGRFYFTATNPAVTTRITGTDTYVPGENWLMELDYVTGGTTNQPFLDLSGDIQLDDADRIKYIASDTIPTGKVVGDPILGTDGIPVGKFISIGVLSQPILVQLITLNDTLFNQNPDVFVPNLKPDRGVEGGHFDVEIYYGTTKATITIANPTTGAGQTNLFPATLGAITVDGVVVIPALTVAELVNGGGSPTATGGSGDVIKNKVVTANGFKASRSSNVITITAPDVSYLGKTMVVADGTSLGPLTTVSAGVRSTGLIRFSGGNTSNTNSAVIAASLTSPSPTGSVKLGTARARSTALTIGLNKTPVQAAAAVVAGIGTGGSIKAYVGGNAITPTCAAATTADVCLVDNVNVLTYPNGAMPSIGTLSFKGALTVSFVAAAGGINPVRSGWTNFKPALTVTTFDNGGGSSSIIGDTCNNGASRCTYKEHDHEYDDIYDKTGVNFLNASNANFNLARAVPSTSTQFKIIGQNQYLSPALRLHIGNAGYLFNIDSGYIDFKTFTTADPLAPLTPLDLATLPTYTRATIGSLAFNLPPTAFAKFNWWGGHLGLPADARDGLHPTEADCVFRSADAVQDGNMYRPVIPPATVTDSGNGVNGWSASTTQNTATGVRHNGAATLQIIRADTPNSAIEQSIPGRSEYGWRVKANLYSTYVIASYSIFHHTKHLGLCYGEENVTFVNRAGISGTNVSWNKNPLRDTRTCGLTDSPDVKRCAVDLSALAGPDPKIGNLGGGSAITSTVTVISGNVTTTTITYLSGGVATVVRTVRDDGSISIVSRDVLGVETTQVIANKSGAVKSGGDERGLQARTGRISWRELVAP
jgi:hypothetical protein